MPRDGAGNYTLPAGNPVVSGTVIESVWANTTMEDIATALTNSLSRNGNGGMLAPLGFVDGSVVAPGMFFTAQVNMGLHRANVNDMQFVMGGAVQLRVTDTFVDVVNGTLTVAGNDVITTAGGQTINGSLDVDGALDVDGNVTVNGFIDATSYIQVQRTGVTNLFIGKRVDAGDGQILMSNISSGFGFIHRLTSAGVLLIGQTNDVGGALENWIVCRRDAEVELYYNNSLKLETKTDGVDVAGFMTATQLQANGNNNVLLDMDRNGTGVVDALWRNDDNGAKWRLFSGSGNFVCYQAAPNGDNQDAWIACTKNGGVTLYHDNSAKLASVSSGASVTGSLTATGSITGGTSDERLKDIHEYITPFHCLNAVSCFDVVHYTLNDLVPEDLRGEADIGLLAGQVAEFFPELTPLAPFDSEEGESKSGENYRTIRYERLVAVLVGAIQELTDRVEELENA